MSNYLKNKNLIAFLYCAVISFLLLLICSRSSFLYPCNNWDDANCYFSMGKAIFNQKVPYRDVFDHKGFYLYFLYGLAYLFSHTTFAGVFILEIVLCTFFLFGAYRILLLYVKERTAYVLLPLFGAVCFSSYSFYWGGSAEEVCLPFYMWGLYLSLRYFKLQYPACMKPATVFSGGILAGIVAMIKFTGLGFFFAWMAMIAFTFLLHKDFKGLIKNCLIFLSGMFAAAIPCLLYFAINGALYDLYWGYIYINVFVYSDMNEQGPSVLERIYTLSKLLYWLIIKNIQYFAFTILGVLKIIFSMKNKWIEKVNLILLCFFLFLGIYIGGSELPYYALPLCIFSILGFAAVGAVLEKLIKSKLFTSILTAVSVGISILFVVNFSMNTHFMSYKKEDHFLFKFKAIVDQTDDPTLLNIGCLDAGLYTVCDIVPSCLWFQTPNLGIPDVADAQRDYIREGLVDYVLARDSYPEVIWEQYELAAQEPCHWDGMDFTYYLFRKK